MAIRLNVCRTWLSPERFAGRGSSTGYDEALAKYWRKSRESAAVGHLSTGPRGSDG